MTRRRWRDIMRCKKRRGAATEENVSCAVDCIEHGSTKVACPCDVFPFAICKSLCIITCRESLANRNCKTCNVAYLHGSPDPVAAVTCTEADCYREWLQSCNSRTRNKRSAYWKLVTGLCFTWCSWRPLKTGSKRQLHCFIDMQK
jgi:hypothetical protein